MLCTTGFPKTALPESMPQSGTPKLFTLHSSLFTRSAPAFPSHFPGRPENRPPQGGGGSVPRQQCGAAKRPFPPHSPACRAQAHSEPVPQSGTPQLFTFPYSLFTRPTPAFPSHFPGAPESCSQQGGGGSVSRRQCGTAKRPFPRTAPHAGHRLILNPCRRAALRNSSLFTLPYSLSQPCPFFPPGRTAKQKYILFLAT